MIVSWPEFQSALRHGLGSRRLINAEGLGKSWTCSADVPQTCRACEEFSTVYVNLFVEGYRLGKLIQTTGSEEARGKINETSYRRSIDLARLASISAKSSSIFDSL